MRIKVQLLFLTILTFTTHATAQKLYVGSGLSYSYATDILIVDESAHPEIFVEFEGSFSLKHKWTVGLNWWKVKSEAYTDLYTYIPSQGYVYCESCPDDWEVVDVNLNFISATTSYRYELNTAAALDFGWVFAVPISANAKYQEPTRTTIFGGEIINEAPFKELKAKVKDQYSMYMGPSFAGVYKFNRIYTSIYMAYLLGKMPDDPILGSAKEQKDFLQIKLRIGYRLI